MTEGLLLILAGWLIGRVLVEFNQEPFDLGLTKYRVSVDQHRRRNQSIYYKDH